MDLYQDVFFRGMDAVRRRHTIRHLRFLRESQYWEPERLAAWQLERLNGLLLQARYHSPHYARSLARVRLPLRSLGELADLPKFTKAIARREYHAIPATNLPRSRFQPSRTGGSTGEPMHYYWDRLGKDWNRASVYRDMEWAGVSLGERTVEMSGSHFDHTRARSARGRAAARLMRFRVYSVAFLTEELLESYVQAILRWRPTNIVGYSSGIATLARYIRDEHPGVDLSTVSAVFTGSESLRPEQRRLIESAFGAGKVYDTYGAREMYMGAECSEHDGHHLNAEVVLLEVVDRDDRPCAAGERGRILLTDLSNHAFPFIRYEVGDLGVLGDPAHRCPCGLRLPKLAKVEGRIADMVVLRDRVLTPPNFTILMSDIRGLDAFQIRQPTVDRVDAYLVPGPGYQHDVADYVRRSIEAMVDGQARVAIHEVAQIDVPESGKRRFVVSEVSGGQL